MAWTTEKIKQLKKLWSKGKSTVEIGKELGISKNAVVGKVHRLELEARPSPIKKQEKQSHKTSLKPKSKSGQKTMVGLLDLKMNSCRWPIGDPKEPGFHFCGAQVSTGKPYCPEHCKVAYTSLKELTLQNAKAKKEKAAAQAAKAEEAAKQKAAAKDKPAEKPTKSGKTTKAPAKKAAGKKA